MTTTLDDRLAVAPRPDREHHRLDHLDALRGIAALSVVASHYNLAFGLPFGAWALTHTPLHIWWDGAAAVSFFFVLSGLVLSYRHFRTTAHPNLDGFSFKGYAIARFCRIWLPYLVILLVSIPLVQLSAQDVHTVPASTPWLAEFWTKKPTPKSVLRQALDLRVASPGDSFSMLVPQAWSLSVEMVMSLLVPLAIVAAGRSTVWFLASVLLAVTLARLSPFALHFSIGIVLAKHYRAIVGWLEPRAAVKVLMAIAGLIFYTYSHFKLNFRYLDALNIDVCFQALGSALFVAVVSASRGVRGWLSRGLIHHIGRVSFSIYLIHMAILYCLTPRVLSVMGGTPPVLAWAVGFVFTVAMSIAVAGPLYWYVEVPTMALGKRAR